MGCTNSAYQVQQQILPMAPDITNSYIDRIPLIIINKIRDKFQSYCKQSQNELNLQQFYQLFSFHTLNDTIKKNLFSYFTNNNSRKRLRINKFIQKYSILIKSNEQHFIQIIHRIFCKSVESPYMDYQQFNFFIQQNYLYLKNGDEIQPNKQKIPLNWNQFYILIKQKLNLQGLQKSFQMIQIDQLPFKQFHEQYLKFNWDIYEKDQSYYIVPAQWFKKWLLFYGYQDSQDLKNFQSQRSSGSNIKLTKKHSSSYTKRKISKNHLNNSKIIQKQTARDLQIMQPPTQIIFNQILGQYQGQLKQKIFVQNDLEILNKKMWNILISLMKTQIQIKRKAISQQNIQFYPLSIYLYNTHQNGYLQTRQYKIIRMGRNQTIQQLKQYIIQNKLYNHNKIKQQNFQLYYKFFGNQKFCLCSSSDKTIGQISEQNLRIVVVLVKNQTKFIQLYQRQQISLNNFTIGDLVLAYFSYQNKFVNAYILKIQPSKKQCKVHFKGYSYLYEKWIKFQNIKITKIISNNDDQNNQNLRLSILQNNQKEQIFQGLRNIGNTCFMNSILQSLVSTTILDKFYLKAKLSQKKYPLNFSLSKVFKGLKNNQNFQISDFKKIINQKLPIFSGYDQQDAQQFLNLLLDKMDEQLVQRPNVVDQLFSGVMQSKFTCLKCKLVKRKQQKIHSISLPIPQSQYNYYKIFVFPMYSSSVKKLVLRLHKNAKVNQYLNEIQNITKLNRIDFIWVECQYSVMRRFKNQLIIQANYQKKIIDFGLSYNMEIYAFQRHKNYSFNLRLREKQGEHQKQLRINNFYDFYLDEQGIWGLTRIINIQKDKIQIQILKESNIVQTHKIKFEEKTQSQFYPIGSKVQQKISRKVFFRKFSQQQQRMVFFDFSYFIAHPKWASYLDTVVFLQQFLKKNLKSQSQNMRKSEKKIKMYENIVRTSSELIQEQNLSIDQEQLKFGGLSSAQTFNFLPNFYINCIQVQKNLCVFCKKQQQQFRNVNQIKQCCQPSDKQIPIFWYSQDKYYNFFIDWVDLNDYNQKYAQSIDIDITSISNENKMIKQKINLQQCLQLWNKPQKIQMQCEKCRFNEHLLQTTIKKTPLITIFHLKQFKYTEQGQLIKLDVNLQWRQAINLGKYCTIETIQQKKSKSQSQSNIIAQSSSSLVYQLYSVIEHQGTTNSGHYTSLSKRHHPFQKRKVWVHFDDDKTQLRNQKPQIIKNAYLLFFRKVQMPSSAIVHFSI